MRKVKTTEDMQRSNSSSDRPTTKSDMENYWDRVHWELPSEEHLKGKHPLTNVADLERHSGDCRPASVGRSQCRRGSFVATVCRVAQLVANETIL